MTVEAWTQQSSSWSHRDGSPVKGHSNRGSHAGAAPQARRFPSGTIDLTGRAQRGEEAAQAVTQRPPVAVQSRWARVAKRVVDLVVGVPVLLLLAVLYPVVALALKITSPGPVLFKQVRVGLGGRPIVIYKFRSMHADAEAHLRFDPELYEAYRANGFKVPSKRDPRITTVGRFLRKTSLDELPQALCVIRGTMSAIGPRPVVPDELAELYGDAPDCYLACKPGLTGLWQTSGRSHVMHDDRAQLDVCYATEWTLRRDVVILVRTVFAVLSANGAH